MTVERRYIAATVELRASKGGPGVLAGYAAKFGKYSQDLGGFTEVIDKRAFTKTLADGADVLARYNHDDNLLLGRTSSGTVRLSVDSVGLMYEVDLPDTTVGRDLAVLAARGDVTQSSFAFRTIADDWSQTDRGTPLRSLLEVSLADVAPVNTPAYLDTSVGLRSLADHSHAPLDEVEQASRDGDLKRFLTEYVPLDAEDRAGDDQADQGGPEPIHPPISLMLRIHDLERKK